MYVFYLLFLLALLFLLTLLLLNSSKNGAFANFALNGPDIMTQSNHHHTRYY